MGSQDAAWTTVARPGAARQRTNLSAMPLPPGTPRKRARRPQPESDVRFAYRRETATPARKPCHHR